MKLLFRDSDKTYVTRTRRRDTDPSDQDCVDAISQSRKDSFSLDNTLSDWAIVTIDNATWDANGHETEIDYTHVNSTSITSSPRPETYYLEVTTDATDSGAPVDGTPDIAADGAATCTITVTKKKKSDDSTDTSGDDTIYLETTGGKLTSQSLTLSSGVDSTTLTSADEQKCVVVTAYDSAGGISSGAIKIQFK